MKNSLRRKNNLFVNVKNEICDCFYQSKIKFFAAVIVIAIAFVTGIIVAVKTSRGCTIESLGHYGVVDLSRGLSSSFFSRLFSMILVMLLLFGFSYTKFCTPLAFAILAYRAYLLGLNLAIMFILFGLPGMIISVIVALPCQLIALAVFLLFYLSQCKCSKEYCGCGRAESGRKLQILLLGLIFLLLICLLETLLLVLFSAKVILVI